MRKRLTLGSILFLTSVMLAFQNCAKHEDNPISEAELLSLKVQEYNVRAGELFTERCSACHSDISNLDLNSFEVQFLLDNNYIVKGDPQLSPLYVFMIDNHPGLIDEIKPELNSNDLAFF